MLLKLFKNSSNQNQENHNREEGLDTMNFDDFTAPFTLFFSFIHLFLYFLDLEDISTLETLFYLLSKHLEFFSILFLGVWLSL